MEFWGVELKPGQTLKVEPGEGKYLHLSQAALGETKAKEDDDTFLYVIVDNQKLVLGTLSAEKCARMQFDLEFEKEFQLCHSSKNASVYLCGYKDFFCEDRCYCGSEESDSDGDQDTFLDKEANGKSPVKDEQAESTAEKANAIKTDVSTGKAKPKVEEPKQAVNIKANEDEDDDNEDSEADESDEDDDEDMAGTEDDSEDVDKESSDEEEAAVVKKPAPSNKRKAVSAIKAPVPEKKAKIVNPGPDNSQKKGGPDKKGDKSKQQSPKSGGSFSGKSRGKNFNSDNARQSRTKAKHK